MIKILCIGDIFGDPGRRAVKEVVPRLIIEEKIDLVIANGENAAQGRGISTKMVHEMLKAGVDILTSGNHIWHVHEIYSYLDTPDAKLLRPANITSQAPGHGGAIVETKSGGVKVGVINLMGRNFMTPPVNCPYQCIDNYLIDWKGDADVIVVDMHAESTAEKRALGWYLDGKAQIVFGTHTHVQTADEEVLPQGCAYITDLGMTGPYNSVIGMKKELAIKKMRTTLPSPFEVASGDVRLCGVIVMIDERAKKAINIKRVCEKIL